MDRFRRHQHRCRQVQVIAGSLEQLIRYQQPQRTELLPRTAIELTVHGHIMLKAISTELLYTVVESRKRVCGHYLRNPLQ